MSDNSKKDQAAQRPRIFTPSVRFAAVSIDKQDSVKRGENVTLVAELNYVGERVCIFAEKEGVRFLMSEFKEVTPSRENVQTTTA